LLGDIVQFFTGWGDFLSNYSDELTTRTVEHVTIVLQAVVISAAIGITLGILINRYRRLAAPVIGTASIILTLPSYAVFGFFGVWLGYNPRATITALTLYALLPTIRNTYVGLRQVDPAVLEAARGMGFNARQILLRVRLPIATPVILAGVRQAAVLNVAITTIGAAVASGGLGTPIFRAIARTNFELLVAATVLVALIGISIDLLLGLLERGLRDRYLRRARLLILRRVGV
jgi:osmoprotectant transport system permease protein